MISKPGAGRSLRVLWVMRSPVFVRNHEAVLRELVAHGHSVHVAFEGDKEGVSGQLALPRALAADLPGITLGRAPRPRGLRALVRRRARGGIDWLRYLEPAYRDAAALRRRAADFAPPGLPAAGPLVARRPAARSRMRTALRRLAAMPAGDRGIAALLESQRPDVLVVTPLMHFGSPQPDYVRLARAAGIPSALVTFSWDNFTNKSLMHQLPDLVTVWNELQAAEAVEHHGVRREQVAVTGAPAYDHWFGWQPRRDRAAFCAGAGLDPNRPYLLYACSSPFVAGNEPEWVRDWLAGIRDAVPDLRDVGVLVRPHPLNAAVWRGVSLPGAAVWPRDAQDPTDDAARADYFDSLHHAAAVAGINTSALVEAAIAGRRTYTVRAPQYRDTQEGTLHFHHLRADRGGSLTIADSLREHASQLAAQLETPSGDADLEDFVQRFVRPHGLGEPAAPRVVAALEALATGVRAR